MTALYLALCLAAPDADNPSLFARAGAAQDQGDYARAANLTWQLISRGSDSGWLYYNLGNSRLRQGELGLAIAAYRRAEARLPRSGDVRANLAYARAQVRDRLAPIGPSPTARAVAFWYYGLSLRELLLLTTGLNALTFAALAARLFARSRGLGTSVALFAGPCLALALGGVAVRLGWPTRIAVCVRDEVQVHSGTHPDTVVRFVLHAGSEARRLDARDGWLRIALADGKQGWVAQEDVVQVEVP